MVLPGGGAKGKGAWLHEGGITGKGRGYRMKAGLQNAGLYRGAWIQRGGRASRGGAKGKGAGLQEGDVASGCRQGIKGAWLTEGGMAFRKGRG